MILLSVAGWRRWIIDIVLPKPRSTRRGYEENGEKSVPPMFWDTPCLYRKQAH